MSPMARLADFERDCFPRVSGDEPELLHNYALVCMFSPREWG